MEVSAADVKKLRDRTGVQMMKCKAALVEAGGDLEKAYELIRKRTAGAANKPDRVTAEGRIGVHLDPTAKVGSIIEVRCESAPVAKNEMFVQLTQDLARQVTATGPADDETFRAQALTGSSGKTVRERISEVVALMNENVTLGRMARFEGTLGQYVHHDGSVGVLLQVEGSVSDPQILRDVCMHIAAKSPLVALRDQVPQDRVAQEMEIARSQALEQGKNKPANIIEKIAEGKVKTWFAENVLAEQPFVKDESKTVGELLQSAGLKLKQFVRYRIGEASA